MAAGTARRSFRLTMLLALLTACLMFLPAIVEDQGMLTLLGDFDEQQIPFNIHAIDMVKAGRFGWDWTVDLGTPFIGAFGFYTLGSPFFWLAALCPADWFPWLVAWLYILKYAVAAATAHLFVRRYLALPGTAAVVSLFYAFSGFNQINLMYYHFHDVVALFPLLLWGLDQLVLEGRRGIFALMTALMAFVNYFFLVAEVIFLLLYFIFRHAPALKAEGRLAVVTSRCFAEGVTGVMAAAVMLVPSFLFVRRSPRNATIPLSLGTILHERGRLPAMLKGLIMPAESMSRQSAFFAHDFSSNALYLPGVGPALALSARKGQLIWAKRLLAASAVIAAIPFLNSALYGFTNTYYARWFYMPILILALLSGAALEKADPVHLKRGFLITFGLVIAVIALAMADGRRADGAVRTTQFAVVAALALMGLLTVFVFAAQRQKNVRIALILGATVLFAVLSGLFSIHLLRVSRDARTPYDEKYLEYALRLDRQESRPDDSYPYRIWTSVKGTNLPMMLLEAGTNSFITTVSPTLFSFYEQIGNKRYVSTSIVEKPLPLASALSANRMLVRHQSIEDTITKMPSLIHRGTFEGEIEAIHLFENPHAVSLGFTHRYYLPASIFREQPPDVRQALLLKALIVADEDLPAIENVLERLPDEAIGSDNWQTAAANRRTPQNVNRDDKGFSAEYRLTEPAVAWFSVPHEPGWHAEVNGEPATIIDSLSMMAVRLPAGDSRVAFHYSMPGLKAGAVMSLLGAAGCAFLLMLNRRKKERVHAGI